MYCTHLHLTFAAQFFCMALVDQEILHFAGKEYDGHTILKGSICHTKGEAVFSEAHKDFIVHSKYTVCAACMYCIIFCLSVCLNILTVY